MKKYILYSLSTVSLLTSCVHKTKKHTLTLLLDVSEVKNIKKVGIRGNDKPFSWDNDTEMVVVKKDSLYKKTYSFETGRICTEIKFTVNGNFELQNKQNRKIYFNQNGETVYKTKFDVCNTIK
jgi:hypothetical protein